MKEVQIGSYENLHFIEDETNILCSLGGSLNFFGQYNVSKSMQAWPTHLVWDIFIFVWDQEQGNEWMQNS